MYILQISYISKLIFVKYVRSYQKTILSPYSLMLLCVETRCGVMLYPVCALGFFIFQGVVKIPSHEGKYPRMRVFLELSLSKSEFTYLHVKGCWGWGRKHPITAFLILCIFVDGKIHFCQVGVSSNINLRWGLKSRWGCECQFSGGGCLIRWGWLF